LLLHILSNLGPRVRLIASCRRCRFSLRIHDSKAQTLVILQEFPS